MDRITYAQVQDLLGRADLSAWPKMNLLVLRNIVLEPIEPFLRYFGYLLGYDVKVAFGGYDNVYQDAVDAPLEGVDGVLVFLNLEGISHRLANGLPAMTRADIEAEKTRIMEFIAAAMGAIRKRTPAIILWHGFELPTQPAFGIIDRTMGACSQQGIIEELNRFIAEKAAELKNGFLVDLNGCLIRTGARDFYDRRYWFMGRAPYSREGLRAVAYEDFKYLRAAKGKSKKCLVLDCDNTLWGGIVGEEGLDKIQLSRYGYPGNVYRALQQEILNLHHRGVILAVCSKNNEADVWEVFDKHPDMLLKREHIAASQINWESKADGLAKIAEQLNIGVDSLVLLDDSEFEVHLIKEKLPDVQTILLRPGAISGYPEQLASSDLFSALTLTDEDRNRGAMYKAQVLRQDLKSRFTDMDGYYRSLEMRLTIRPADEASLARIAQLTQKTNQFTLTTRRYTEVEIRALLEKPEEAEVLSIALRDRFGDFGLIGAAILRYRDKAAVIDSFLLSCRALGRGVEDAFLVHIAELAQRRGRDALIGEYLPSRKNGQTRDFYPRHGFATAAEGPERTEFRLPLTELKETLPAYFAGVDRAF